jgi:hypothetical protein
MFSNKINAKNNNRTTCFWSNIAYDNTTLQICHGPPNQLQNTHPAEEIPQNL